MVNSSSQYSFPSMRINYSVESPTPLNTDWRNTIGVVAPFSRGPQLSSVKNYSDFVALFGDDDSVGSVVVRQAVAQGATNFVISRVTPVISPAGSTIPLSAPNNPTTIEATTGSGAARTIGVSLDFNYVGQPRFLPGRGTGYTTYSNGAYVNEVVYSVSNPVAFSPDYSGLGKIDGRLVETIDLGASYFTQNEALDLVVSGIAVAGANAVKLVTFDKYATNADALKDYIRPGLRVVPSGETGLTITSVLNVASYVYEVNSTTWGFLVKGAVTAVSNGPEVVRITRLANEDEGYKYIFGFNFVVDPETNKESDASFKQAANKYRIAGYTDSFIAVLASTTSTSSIDFYSGATVVPSGLTFTLGSASTNHVYIAEPFAFSVSVLKVKLLLGETNLAQANPENTSKAFAPGTPVSSIIKGLQDKILRNAPLNKIFSEVRANTDQFPNSLTFSTRGNNGDLNGVTYQLNQFAVGQASDIQYNVGEANAYGEPQSLTGGLNKIVPASTYLYDNTGAPIVFIQALSPGLIGNEIFVTVTQVGNGEFNLYVEHIPKSSKVTPIPSETFALNNYGADKVNGLYVETKSSKLIRAYFIPYIEYRNVKVPDAILARTPARLAGVSTAISGQSNLTSVSVHPSNRGLATLKRIPLTGGNEPANYTQNIPIEDYLAAAKRLEDQDVAFLTAPGLTIGDSRYEDLFQELYSQSIRSTAYNGLRFLVAAAPKQLTSSRAQQLAVGFAAYPAVIIGGWSSFLGAREKGQNAVSPEGYYLGVLATTSPEISPASNFTVGAIAGVKSVDTTSDLNTLHEITNAQVELLHFNPATNSFKFLNGRSTSNDPNYLWISHLRIQHHISSTIFNNLQWALSSSNTPTLWAQISQSVDAILKNFVRSGIITNFEPTVVGASNNTSTDLVSGKLNIRVAYTPPFPADYHQYDIRRVVYSELILNFAAV